MPHLRMRNLPIDTVLASSARLADRLAEAVQCERDWITIEHEAVSAIRDGSIVPGNPFVEVLWFDRPAATRAAVAKILDEELRGQAATITVVFRALDREGYYENGEKF